MRFFRAPVWRARAPQGFGKAPRRGRGQGCPRPDPATGGRVGRARAPKPRMRGSSRAIRGVLLFGYFLLDKQEKVALGAGREHPAFKYTWPVGRLDRDKSEIGRA